MKDNRYFEVNLPNSELAKIYDVIVGLPSQQVPSKNKNKIIVKLCKGDIEQHPCMNSAKELTKAEAQELTSVDL